MTGARKGTNKKTLTLGCFGKNSLLIHYFLLNLIFFRAVSICFENVPRKALYIGKNGVWNSFQISAIIPKNLFYYVSETLATYTEVCLRMHALAHVRKLLPTYLG